MISKLDEPLLKLEKWHGLKLKELKALAYMVSCLSEMAAAGVSAASHTTNCEMSNYLNVCTDI